MTSFPLHDARALIALDFARDLGAGDLSTLGLPDLAPRNTQVALVAREAGVIAGLEAGRLVWDQCAYPVRIDTHVQDGESVVPGQLLASYSGAATDLLAGERTLLNFISHLSGIATLTSRYVAAVGNSPTKICDTRKTLPGLRTLQKYAVRCGGGVNHRMSLNDAVMLKDNHLTLIGDDLTDAVAQIRARVGPTVRIEIEADSVELFQRAASAGADVIMLDNMNDAALAVCVAARPAGVLLEVSGGVTLERVPTLAALGVDFISVGRLTHSAPALDLALDFQPPD